jgi:hypothetical protein
MALTLAEKMQIENEFYDQLTNHHDTTFIWQGDNLIVYGPLYIKNIPRCSNNYLTEIRGHLILPVSYVNNSPQVVEFPNLRLVSDFIEIYANTTLIAPNLEVCGTDIYCFKGGLDLPKLKKVKGKIHIAGPTKELNLPSLESTAAISLSDVYDVKFDSLVSIGSYLLLSKISYIEFPELASANRIAIHNGTTLSLPLIEELNGITATHNSVMWLPSLQVVKYSVTLRENSVVIVPQSYKQLQHKATHYIDDTSALTYLEDTERI